MQIPVCTCAFDVDIRAICCVVQSALTSAGSQSSLFSTGSTVDVGTFSDSLEKLLTWLRDASDAVSNLSPVANVIDTLKDQFHRHEV